MTLSEFLENKKQRSQLPSEEIRDLSQYSYSAAKAIEPKEITDIRPSPTIGHTNTGVILSMLNDNIASRNFNMRVLSGAKSIDPNLLLKNLSAISFIDGDPIAKAYLTMAGSESIGKADVRLTNKALGINGNLINQTASKIRFDEQANVKGTGLVVDGFSGGASNFDKNEVGIIPNRGTMAAGSELSDEDKEALRKVHLRNYWKMSETKALKPKTFGGASLSSGYRDLLNKRLKGVTDAQAKEGSFLTGYGLSPSEFKALMTNDSISGNIDPNNHSIESITNAVVYGLEAKRDTIIDTGRFNYGNKATEWETPYPQLMTSTGNMNTKGKVIFNISSFAADPARTPFFRKQILSLGNEVTVANSFLDMNYVSTNGFSINIINGSRDSWGVKHASWAWDDKTKGSNTGTALYAIRNRYPDFMGNMSYVFFANSEDTDGIVDSSGNEIKQDIINVEPARILDISVKMPSLKVETLEFANRSIPVLSNAINMSHQGSIKIRVDENLFIWRKMLASSGIVLEHAGYRTGDRYNDIADQQITNQVKTDITTLRNGATKVVQLDGWGSEALEVDLYVAYGLITSFLPDSSKSLPYGAEGIMPYLHDNSDTLYSRYYIFRGVRFLGVPELEFSKDSNKVEMSFDFVFKRIDEEEYGHGKPSV